jgi:hypothetical protein
MRSTLPLLALLALWPTVGAPQVPPRPSSRPIGVLLLPFVLAEADSATRRLSEDLTKALSRHLANQPGIVLVDRSPAYLARVLEDSAERRRFVPARVVVEAVLAPRTGALTLKAVEIETGSPLLADTATLNAATIEVAAANLADRIARTVIRHSREHPSDSVLARPLVPQIPVDALTAYSRALLYRDRGDTAQAVFRLQQALRAYPNWPEPCLELRRIRPNATCP